MKLHEQVTRIFSYALLAFIFIVFSLLLLDLPLAAWVAEYLRTKAWYVKTSNIPDLLMITAVSLTVLSWVSYFWLLHRNIHDKNTFFFRVTGTVLPLSFVVKSILKWLFGRTETRTWLSDPSLYGFHWFAGTAGTQGFPSGHMLVLTPLLLAMWDFYPRYRLYYGIVGFCLGTALIATDYHFLSDVLAGAFTGTIIYLSVKRSVGQSESIDVCKIKTTEHSD